MAIRLKTCSGDCSGNDPCGCNLCDAQIYIIINGSTNLWGGFSFGSTLYDGGRCSKVGGNDGYFLEGETVRFISVGVAQYGSGGYVQIDFVIEGYTYEVYLPCPISGTSFSAIGNNEQNYDYGNFTVYVY